MTQKYSGVYTLSQVAEAVKSQNWTNIPPPNVEYLVVAGGGGGGGNNQGGGGGAGGLLSGFAGITAGAQIWVTVGAGGAGASAGADANGTQGNNSVFNATSSGAATGQVVAVGGGYGAKGSGALGGNGGSGGGGTSGRAGGTGVSGQGNNGGPGDGSGWGGAGGGAGASFAYGRPQNVTVANGIASDITGTRSVYAAGGSVLNLTVNGTANTGNGGWGSSGSPAAGTGGSGIVVISYPDTYAPAASTTGSPTVSTSGAGSLYFDAAQSQNLIFSANAAFQPGTGSFTLEFWANWNKTDVGFFDLSAINSAGSFGVFVQGSTLFVRIDGSSNDLTYTLPAGFQNNWQHIAVVRNGTTLTLYYNGTAVASGTRSNNITQSTPFIGVLNGLSAFYMTGYMTNLRFVVGSAVYTSNFTPSTLPLTSVANTSLLLNCNSGAFTADSSPNGFAPTTGSKGAWNQLSPFATGMGFKKRVYTWTSSGSITF